MIQRFIEKKGHSWKQGVVNFPTKQKEEKPIQETNNQQINYKDMGINNIDAAEALAQQIAGTPKKTKVVKADKGLFERTESSKVILTEDNKQVLMD